MDINNIMNAITTVGFPIVCCIALFWKMNSDSEKHAQEMNALKDALNNNTLALTELREGLKNGNTDND